MNLLDEQPTDELQNISLFLRNSVAAVPRLLNTVSFKEYVYAGAVLRAGINQNFEYIKPYTQWDVPLTSETDTDIDILKYLYKKSIIVISPNSDTSCFSDVIIEKNKFSFEVNKVCYDFNVYAEKDSGFTYDTLIASMLNPNINKPQITDDVIQVWKEVALTECLQLLNYQIELYRFSYKIGKETIAFFNDVIPKFSLATIYSFIYQAAKSAAAYFQREDIPWARASNSILSTMRTSADRVSSGQWETWKYTRPKECPQFILSDYFFNSVLKLCDRYWNELPYNPLA